ncbi:hypothetical protein EGYY_10470 [Eggerthella sp. YY7918]|nr:hypothetical protein EGYY_10470 [Eggerthella sp. YY7918]
MKRVCLGKGLKATGWGSKTARGPEVPPGLSASSSFVGRQADKTIIRPKRNA